jgi:hypothetical protein
MWRMKLAEVFGSSMEIVCVRDIVFGVHAPAAGEHAVGADMDQTRSGIETEFRDSVRRHRIDFEIGENVVGFASPHYQAYAVDDDLRLESIEDRDQIF